VPIYEFACERCGTRFEELVDAGTESVVCRNCGADRTLRVYSAHGAPFKIVKTPGETRRQEGKNAQLRERTKADVRKARHRSRQARGGGA
jgi:putative FmdB family regulatory protein